METVAGLEKSMAFLREQAIAGDLAGCDRLLDIVGLLAGEVGLVEGYLHGQIQKW